MNYSFFPNVILILLFLSACVPASSQLVPTITSIVPSPTVTSTNTSTPIPTSSPTASPFLDTTPRSTSPPTPTEALFPSDDLLSSVIKPYATVMELEYALILEEIQNDPGKFTNEYIENDSKIKILSHNGIPLIILASNQKTEVSEWRAISLKDLSELLGIKIGVSLLGDLVKNPSVNKIIGQEFNQVTIAGFMWEFLEPQPGIREPGYARWTDSLLNKWDSLRLRGHALLWPAKNPQWLRKNALYNDPNEAVKLIRDHISSIVSEHSRITEWNVVNEPYLWAPQYNYSRPDFFYEVIGDQAYLEAFSAAKDANPDAVLILNDTLNHSSIGKNSMTTKRTKELIDLLLEQNQGGNIVVGMQMHIDASNPPSEEDLVSTFQFYGVPIYITEMDVDISSIMGDQKERFFRQSEIYENIITACLKSGVCESITFWAIGDKYSWLEIYRNRPNSDATLFDDDLNAKPAYYAVLKALYQHLLAQQSPN